jgi:excisionase family DNA binding protein
VSPSMPGNTQPATPRRAPDGAVHPSRQFTPNSAPALIVKEVAWELNVHPNTVGNLIESGELESFTLGRKRLVARSAIRELMARGGSKEARPPHLAGFGDSEPACSRETTPWFGGIEAVSPTLGNPGARLASPRGGGGSMSEPPPRCPCPPVGGGRRHGAS